MLGSLESIPVTASVDGVVLAVRRGRSRTRLEECMERLDANGAYCLGTVLNCAGRSDCHRYVSEASIVPSEHELQAGSQAAEGAGSMVRAAHGEGNALLLAMESTSRVRPGDELENAGSADEASHDFEEHHRHEGDAEHEPPEMKQGA